LISYAVILLAVVSAHPPTRMPNAIRLVVDVLIPALLLAHLIVLNLWRVRARGDNSARHRALR